MRFRRLRHLPALLVSASALAGAATLSSSSTAAATPDADARMVVEAKEMVYNEKKNTVTARGQVQILYKGRLLEADQVVYDRNTSRVYAEGHAKLTETNGTIARAERFDFTDDFKNGFIESLQVDAANDTHFSAPRAERTGDTTTFDMGSYTACEACKDDPSKPRTWQLKAKRIIHDNAEKMIYYEDATFELLGTPIAYVPFWSSADPTVKRKSGFLTPIFTYRSQLGAGFGVPYFYAIAPDADLTITPTIFTRQGPFLTGEFRKRFENGGFSIRAEGTHVGDPSAFAVAPLGARDREWRGALHSQGEFSLNDRWRAGWDITALSDRYFLQDYKQFNYLLQNYYFRESSSTIYLNGQGPRSFFDMRSYYFQVLSPNDVQAQQPVVHPVTDYNRVFDIDPKKTHGIGGQVEVDANVTSTSASVANYELINPRTLDSIYGLYNVCQLYARANDPSKSSCLLRGIGGDLRTRDSQRELEAQGHRSDWRRVDGLRFCALHRQLSGLRPHWHLSDLQSILSAHSERQPGTVSERSRSALPRAGDARLRRGMALPDSRAQPDRQYRRRTDRSDHRASEPDLHPFARQHGRAEPRVRRTRRSSNGASSRVTTGSRRARASITAVRRR